MTQPPPADDGQPEPLVDTTPADPQRTGVTYGILFVVLALLVAYFVVHARAR
jgi:hypothetical protein